MSPDALIPSRHLILGGNGFVGRKVAELLVQRGHQVILGVRPNSRHGLHSCNLSRLERREFNMLDADWSRLIEDVDVVHHYAWSSVPAIASRDPMGDFNANVSPTIALLEALRLSKTTPPRLLFTSSGGTVYGNLLRVPVCEDHRLSPINPYGSGKAAVEIYIASYRSLYGLDCRVARLANPYGPGQDLTKGQGAVAAFLRQALAREPITIWGDGEIVRDFIHISDVASGLVAIAEAEPGIAHATYNVGSGHGVSLNGIVSELEKNSAFLLM